MAVDKVAVLSTLELHACSAWRSLRGQHGDVFKWGGIYLQGSQNYGVSHEKSDVDSKLIVVPTVEGLLRNVPLSCELTLENSEKVSVKTVPEYVDLFFKGNVNNLEMLYTEYALRHTVIEDIVGFRNDIVVAVQGTMLQAALGMMMQKRKSLHKGTVTTQPFVDQFGYDNKDAVHILRLAALIGDYVRGKPFGEALIVCPLVKPYMQRLREGSLSVEHVTDWADKVIADTKVEVDTSGLHNDPEKIKELRKRCMDIYVDWYKGNMV